MSQDVKNGIVGVLQVDDVIVGTGCYKDNHITRVYVDPEYQGRGYGSYIMQCLEDEISLNYDTVYLDSSAKSEERKIPILIEMLYNYFKSNNEKLPEDIKCIANKEGIDRAVCDYIAGMTDHFAVNMFKSIFIPTSWGI